MVSVRPSYNEVESILHDSDRFEDISHFIYVRNEDSYKKYMKMERKKAEEENRKVDNTLRNEPKNSSSNLKSNVESSVCTIL